MVVLDEIDIAPVLGQPRAIPCLGEKAARIAETRRCQNLKPGNAGRIYLHLMEGLF